MFTSLSLDFSMLGNKTSGQLDFEFMRFDYIVILWFLHDLQVFILNLIKDYKVDDNHTIFF